jgi:hypothetical protein
VGRPPPPQAGRPCHRKTKAPTWTADVQLTLLRSGMKMKTNLDHATVEKAVARGRADRRGLEMKIVRQFRDWIRHPGTLDRVFGPPLSYLEKENKIRRILGIDLLTKADIPPGEDWETPQPHTLMGRKERVDEIFGFTSTDDEQTNSTDENL